MSAALLEDDGVAVPPGAYSTSSRIPWRSTLNLAWTLAVTDWKLRFYGSVLGVAWTLVRPFAFFGVIYVVFTEIAGLDQDVKNYGVYILLALILFTFFGEVTTNSLTALVSRESLLRKMRFNPIVIPLATAITALLNLGITLVAAFAFILTQDVEVRLTWLELLPIVALLTMLATGIGMLLSVLYVRYRDMQPIWEVSNQALFYASAVLYVATQVPEDWQGKFLCNPIAALFTQMRHAIVDEGAPPITRAMGEGWYVLIPLALTFGTFALGMWFFSRESPRVAEHL